MPIARISGTHDWPRVGNQCVDERCISRKSDLSHLIMMPKGIPCGIFPDLAKLSRLIRRPRATFPASDKKRLVCSTNE